MSGTQNVLVATDLDRTLIYSRAAFALPTGVQPPLICVERYLGKEFSFMTRQAAAMLNRLSAVATVLPVTTRLPEQLDRVRLPGGRHRFAVTSNGGVLLVDGQVDRAWDRRVRRAIAEVAPLGEVWSHLTSASLQPWLVRLRNAGDLFCYAIVDPASLPANFFAETTAWAAVRGWRTSLQGRKLYWIPEPLTKSAAVREVARRIDASLVLAAGDSLLDIDLLASADLGMQPAHGELFELGWSQPHVARSSATGVLAGQAIVEWFLHTASVPEVPSRPRDPAHPE
ncbi:HAD family hydrolase [Micromonospora chalcea]|uniref:HAD family hydrolase n=1 Tax=Micromonospora chalcea TaxID=1874 RepID=UPI0038F6FE03